MFFFSVFFSFFLRFLFSLPNFLVRFLFFLVFFCLSKGSASRGLSEYFGLLAASELLDFSKTLHSEVAKGCSLEAFKLKKEKNNVF